MKGRLVLLQAPIPVPGGRPVDRVMVRPGATIEAATGLRTEQVAQLDLDDRFEIERMMAR